MNVAELIKFQLLQRTMGASSSGRVGSNSGQDDDIYTCIYSIGLQALSFAIISGIDECSKLIPQVLAVVKSKYLEKKVSYLANVLDEVPVKQKLCETALLLNTRHFSNSVTLTRKYPVKVPLTNTVIMMNEYVDSIIDLASQLDNVPKLVFTENLQFLVDYKATPIQLTTDLYFRIDNITWSATTPSPEQIMMTLLSNSLTSKQIAEFVRDTHATFKTNYANSLGNKLYFFDQISEQNPNFCLDLRGEPSMGRMTEREHRERLENEIRTASSCLTFSKVPFFSSKTFDNICGPEARQVRERIEFFVNNKEWYKEKGVPYTLGILLSGIPGSGKTSILRAISNYTNRHIINVNFANIKTAAQLRTLFMDDSLTFKSSNETINLSIPINKRLFVLEEIDALGKIVWERSMQITNEEEDKPIKGALTLGDILTILDGTVEIPGRIMCITTNFPERLDKALLRPGRIDLSLKFSTALPETVGEMIELFFDRKVDHQDFPSNLTCAEISQVLFAHLPNSPDALISERLWEMSKKKRDELSQQSLHLTDKVLKIDLRCGDRDDVSSHCSESAQSSGSATLYTEDEHTPFSKLLFQPERSVLFS